MLRIQSRDARPSCFLIFRGRWAERLCRNCKRDWPFTKMNCLPTRLPANASKSPSLHSEEPVQVAQQFVTPEFFTPPTLAATGDTPMANAIITGLDLLKSRKDEYKAGGIGYYRPWMFLITDGAPTDANTPQWSEGVKRIQEGEDKKSFSFFAVGVEGADFEQLKQLSKREPLKLKGLRFRDLFKWLSTSQQTVSQSKVDEAVALPNPAAPDGWATV